MKKAIVTLVLLALVLTMTCACADSFAYQYGQWWVMDDDGYLHSTTSKPLDWKPERLDNNFPTKVVGDVSDICERLNGIELDCLGLVSTAGSNLRSTTSINGKLSYDKNWNQDYNDATIIRKLHASTTVYVNFKFYDSKGDEWYYVTCSDGVTGFLLAKRILVFPLD